jgi:hypothetical protein
MRHVVLPRSQQLKQVGFITAAVIIQGPYLVQVAAQVRTLGCRRWAAL